MTINAGRPILGETLNQRSFNSDEPVQIGCTVTGLELDDEHATSHGVDLGLSDYRGAADGCKGESARVDLLQRGLEWLEARRKQHLVQTVVYEREGESIELAATPGRTEFEQSDEYGGIQRWESRDWLVTTTDLVLAGVQTLPRPGDRIRHSVGASTLVYEVMSPAGMPAFKYTDPYRITLRIHAKQVGTEGQ